MQRRRVQIRLFVLQRLTRGQGRTRNSLVFTGQRRVSPAEFDTWRLDGGVCSQIRTGLRWQFPANREINREFRDSGPSEANFVARNHCAAATFYEIPYAN